MRSDHTNMHIVEYTYILIRAADVMIYEILARKYQDIPIATLGFCKVSHARFVLLIHVDDVVLG